MNEVFEIVAEVLEELRSEAGEREYSVCTKEAIFEELPIRCVIYEEEQKDGRILKGLRFKFSIYMNGRNVLVVDWDNESTDETVVLFPRVRSTRKRFGLSSL